MSTFFVKQHCINCWRPIDDFKFKNELRRQAAERYLAHGNYCPACETLLNMLIPPVNQSASNRQKQLDKYEEGFEKQFQGFPKYTHYFTIHLDDKTDRWSNFSEVKRRLAKAQVREVV
jgi:hypothetical protein